MKKGNTWHFGYKAHVGADKDSGLVHTVEVTAANTHDVATTPKLLTGEEEEVYKGSGYLGAEKRKDAVKGYALVIAKRLRKLLRFSMLCGLHRLAYNAILKKDAIITISRISNTQKTQVFTLIPRKAGKDEWWTLENTC